MLECGMMLARAYQDTSDIRPGRGRPRVAVRGIDSGGLLQGAMSKLRASGQYLC